MITTRSPMLAIKRATVDHDTQAWGLGPRCVISEFDILSWVVYCGYTRPTGCLLFAHLTHTWPTTITMTVPLRVTKKKKPTSFTLVKVHWLTFMIYFIIGIWTNFRNTLVIFLFCIYCPILKYFRWTGNVGINTKLLIFFCYIEDGKNSHTFRLHQIQIRLEKE